MTFGKNKLRVIAGAGATANIFLKARNIFVIEYKGGEHERAEQVETVEFNKINLSPLISLGAEYSLNKTFVLRAEPSFRYALFNATDTPITERQWNFGLNFSCNYLLR